MIKKIINKIIMGTKCYLALRKEFIDLKHDKACLEDELSQKIFVIDVAHKVLQEQKTKARKIVRLLNANFDKKNGTIKQIKALCNEIIKGEN